MELFDVAGRLIYSKQIKEKGNFKIPVFYEDIAVGLYILRLETSEKKYVFKVVKINED